MALNPDPWIENPIAMLVRTHFPELNEMTPEGAAFKRMSATNQQAKRNEAETFQQKLLALSEAELQEAIIQGKRLYEVQFRKFRESELAKPFYDRISAEMDLDHWSRTE